MVRLLPALLLVALAWTACGETGDATPAVSDASGYQGPIDELDLSDYEGRIVVLNFWATWCGPCRVEIPALVQLRKDFPAHEVAVIGVSVDGQSSNIVAQLERFLARYEVNYPVYHDPAQGFAGRFDPTGNLRFVPTTVLIDPKGRIRDTHFGIPRDTKGRIDPYRTLATQVQNLLD
jgi:thiol-disulfide isomerase/thioredoxin